MKRTFLKHIIGLMCTLLFTMQVVGQCPGYNVTFTSQAQIDAFATTYPNCTIVEGWLEISGDDIVDLSGLAQIDQAVQYFLIRDNPQLTSLSGLENMGIGGSLGVLNNPLLTSLDGITGIYSTAVQGLDVISIVDNPSLVSLLPLATLTGFSGRMDIFNNSSLLNLDGINVTPSTFGVEGNQNLERLTEMSSGGSSLAVRIIDNPSLTTLSGLEGITRIDVRCEIINNDSLINLDGLSNVLNDSSSMYTLFRIEGNQLLSDISGLENVFPPTIFELEITDNPNLSQCNIDSVCTHLQQAGTSIVSNNGGGCDSIEAVLVSCGVDTLNDVTIYFFPLSDAQPNQDANYKIILQNIGTSTISGEVKLSYDDGRVEFKTSNPSSQSNVGNSIFWSFSELLPYEIRSIDVTFNVLQSPTNNAGDVLVYEGSVIPTAGDDNSDNNTCSFRHTIVGNSVPNKTEVAQGDFLSINDVGDYMQYIVNFQNLTDQHITYFSINEVLDANHDWDSVEVILSSQNLHSVEMDQNYATFIFISANLQSVSVDEERSKGYLIFQVRTKDNLQIGDIVESKASIKLGSHDPITTNTVRTEVGAVDPNINGNLEPFLQIHPVPVSNILEISFLKELGYINTEMYTISNRRVLSTSETQIDVEGLSAGLYIVKVNTSLGPVLKKIVKQ